MIRTSLLTLSALVALAFSAPSFGAQAAPAKSSCCQAKAVAAQQAAPAKSDCAASTSCHGTKAGKVAMRGVDPVAPAPKKVVAMPVGQVLANAPQKAKPGDCAGSGCGSKAQGPVSQPGSTVGAGCCGQMAKAPKMPASQGNGPSANAVAAPAGKAGSCCAGKAQGVAQGAAPAPVASVPAANVATVAKKAQPTAGCSGAACGDCASKAAKAADCCAGKAQEVVKSAGAAPVANMPAAKKAQPTVDCNGKACDGAACAEMDCASKAQKAASTDCCAGKAQGVVQGAGAAPAANVPAANVAPVAKKAQPTAGCSGAACGDCASKAAKAADCCEGKAQGVVKAAGAAPIAGVPAANVVAPAPKKAQPTVDCNGKACDGAACAEMDCASKAQKAASTDCCAGKAQGVVKGAGAAPAANVPAANVAPAAKKAQPTAGCSGAACGDCASKAAKTADCCASKAQGVVKGAGAAPVAGVPAANVVAPAPKKAQPTVDCNGKACDGKACDESDCASKAQKAAPAGCCAGKAGSVVKGAGAAPVANVPAALPSVPAAKIVKPVVPTNLWNGAKKQGCCGGKPAADCGSKKVNG
ncbi:MAG: hypothetical protein R3F33_15740 [Planctomycetota bacterium]